jgi:DNA modification methylase
VSWEVKHGDALELLKALPEASVQCIVTSPPYWGLRDYGVAGQLGLEATPEEYVAALVALFREARRALRPDGTLWLNLGDTYASAGGEGEQGSRGQRFDRRHTQERLILKNLIGGLKPKDLVGVPWRVAFALQADGWWLRSDIVWSKPNPMPESVRDRPTKAHEYLFLLTKSERYYYDAASIAEPVVYGDHPRNGVPGPPIQAPGQPVQSGITRARREGTKKAILRGVGEGYYRPNGVAGTRGVGAPSETRNRRSVWTITTEPFPEAHFAVMPQALVEPCILAGSRPGDLVVDPCCGSGTVGVVALRHGRRFFGADLNPDYVAMARRRIAGPLFAQEETPA